MYYFVNNAFGGCGHRHKTLEVAKKCLERMELRYHREFGIYRSLGLYRDIWLGRLSWTPFNFRVPILDRIHEQVILPERQSIARPPKSMPSR